MSIWEDHNVSWSYEPTNLFKYLLFPFYQLSMPLVFSLFLACYIPILILLCILLLFTDFDIRFSEANQNIEFDPPTSNQSKLAVSVWLFVPNTLANFSIFNSESSNSRINIYFLDTLDIRINRYGWVFFCSKYKISFLGISLETCACCCKLKCNLRFK